MKTEEKNTTPCQEKEKSTKLSEEQETQQTSEEIKEDSHEANGDPTSSANVKKTDPSEEKDEETNASSKYSFPKSKPPKKGKDERTDEKIDSEVKRNRIDSDKDYRGITKNIIGITKDLLDEHSIAKGPLRFTLLIFVIVLLSVQLVVLALILFLNSVCNLQISDFVINVYIVSLFVETLAGLMVMIKFSFDSTQEVYLIKILHSIIKNFKKFDDK